MGCCRGFLGFLLKFLNFLHAFVGVSVAVYSVWVLKQWMRNGGTVDIDNLSDLWFVWALMGGGAVVCVIVLTGYVAAEIRSGCCLCFYSFLMILLIMTESTLAGGVIFNKNWKQYLPSDSTGELKHILSFIEENIEEFKYVGLSIITIQGMSLFLALSLRAVIPRRSLEYESDEDFVVIRRPLLIPQIAPNYASNSSFDNNNYNSNNRSFHSDVWSSRMRQKYGLNQNTEYAYASVDNKV